MTILARPFLLCSCALGAALPGQILGAPQSSPLPAGFTLMGRLEVGDVDHDGAPDVIAINSFLIGGSLCVLRGNGLGGFGPASSLPLGLPRQTVVADVDGDGALDVWVGGQSSTSVLFRGNGAGGFTAAPTPSLTETFCLADFDGDGRVDLLARNATGVGLALGDGAGHFGAPTSNVALTLSGSLRAGDVDGDGDVDAIGNATGQTWLLRNDGTGHFVAEVLAVPGFVTADLADVDGDGVPDLIGGSFFVGASVHRNDGAGHFASTPCFADPLALRVVAGDIDADGHPDLIVSGLSATQLWRGDGTGAFVVAETYAIGGAAGVALADVDLDGGLDVILWGSMSATELRVLRNQQALPTGVASYGVGTGTCRGRIGMRAVTPPTIGNQGFHVSCSNAPANSIGMLLMGTRVTNGWDPFGLDLVLHLGIAVPVGTMTSDSAGAARRAVPIPAWPFLVGLTVHMQSVWLADAGAGDTCSPAWSDLASSRGLSVTLQP